MDDQRCFHCVGSGQDPVDDTECRRCEGSGRDPMHPAEIDREAERIVAIGLQMRRVRAARSRAVEKEPPETEDDGEEAAPLRSDNTPTESVGGRSLRDAKM